jgi:hypothetical protein
MESTGDQCFVVDGPLKVIRVGGSDLWLAWVLARQRLKPRNRIARVTLPPLSYPVGIGSLVVGNALAGSGGGGPLRRDRDSFYRWCRGLLLKLAPKASGKPASTFVDATLPLDELVERFGIRLAFQRVPERAGPFRPGALINLSSISGAANDGGKRFDVVGWAHTPQPQRLVSAVESAVFSRPPRNQIEDGGQIAIDRVAISAGLALRPSSSQPQ